jgi:hypothetical protein
MEELLSSILFDPPHIMCLTEHHIKEYEVNDILIDNYELGAKYCGTVNKNVCIFIDGLIKFNNVPVVKYCVEEPLQLN